MVKKSRVLCVVALVLVCSILINTVGASGAGVNVRNIQLDISPEYEKYMNCYEEKSISYDEDEELVKFYGKAAYSESDSALFDNVSMEEYAEDEADVVYECSFDMEAMEFHFTASLLNEAGEAIAVEEYHTDAIVTENGALDACIEIDGEEYMLSDYRAEEMLSDTIYAFEYYAIIISSGFGNLGSNPLEIGRYLDKRGVKYTKYISYYSFKKAVEKSSGCRVIMSRWNASKKNGLHTFYVNKISSTKYRSYNWQSDIKYVDKSSISSYNDGSGFIIGYVISK